MGRSVSVVLATREASELVLARVQNLLDTDHPLERLEIIVVRDVLSREIWPVTAFEGFPVRVVDGDQPGGKAAALNAGVRASQGEVLVMADTAQRFTRDTIPELVAALEDARFGAISGALELGRAGGASPVHWYWSLEKWLRHSEARIHSSIGVTGAVYAMRRQLWVPIPDGTLLDDVFVPMSLVLRGYRVGFSYAAQAYDVRSFSSKAEETRKTRTLTGVLQLIALLPETLSRRNPVVLQFVMHKLARLATPLLIALFLPVALWVFTDLARAYPASFGGGTAATIAVVLTVPRLRQKTASAFGWFYSMQRATIIALFNGLRGNWSVWGSPK